MNIVIPLFPRFTVLDAVGPYEVLSRLPGAKVVVGAVEPGLIRDATGMLQLEAPVALADVKSADVLCVPGGPGTRRPDPRLVEWIRAIHPTTKMTTSVCTGSLLLAAAGVLEGLPATSHWFEIDNLANHGAIPTRQRIVFAGKIATAAGVSAGIDLALALAARLASEDVARAIQLAIEYDPEPPFDAGSVEKAPPAIVELVRSTIQKRMAAGAPL
jgi:putative intracellular protease/amidase